MSSTSDLWRASASDLVRDYSAGLYTPVDVVESCLRRIAQVDAAIGAFVLVAEDEALVDARGLTSELRRGLARGPLHGVPFAVKDIFDVAGTVTTAGSNVPVAGKASPAPRDATVVQRMRQAGGIFLGRTRTHEYAWGVTTRHPDGSGTANPWNLGRIPGGSSGGSAAAVAAGFVPLALGTDTGGSIRIPAAFCGVVGWKPRYGSIPLDGVVPLAPSLDHVGLLGRTVDDVTTAHLIATGGNHQLVEPPDPRSLRIGIPTDPSLPRLESTSEAVVAEAMAALTGAGVKIRPVSLPSSSEAMDVFTSIQMSEALGVHRDLLGTWPRWAATYGGDIADRLRLAESVTDQEVAAALVRRESMKTGLARSLSEVDAVIVPVAPCPAPTVMDPNHVKLNDETVPLRQAVLPFTVLANLTGAPCMALPAGRDDGGLPVGVQILAAPEADELKVLAVAATLARLFGPTSFPPSSDGNRMALRQTS
jgi:aspartyl-tRNA(Asn)/glutamyl-tRNA(Gln) amidotransferase subunit A